MKTICLITVLLVLGSGKWSAAQTTRRALPPATRRAAIASQDIPPGVRVVSVVHDTNYMRPDPERIAITLDVRQGVDLAYVYRYARADKAVDGLGRSMVLDGPMPSGIREDDTSGSGVKSVNYFVTVFLKPTPIDQERAGKIKLIEGEIHAALAAAPDKIEITGAGNQVREYPGGAKVSLTVEMIDANTCKVDTTIDYPAGMSDVEKKSWHSQMPAHVSVKDSTGKTWHMGGGSSSGGADKQGDTHLKESYKYTLPGAAGPVTVTLEIVSQSKETTIPFKVEDVPLP